MTEELAYLDTASKLAFGAVDWRRRARAQARAWRCSLQGELVRLRMEQPMLFDQILVVLVAGLVELVVSHLSRSEHHG